MFKSIREKGEELPVLKFGDGELTEQEIDCLTLEELVAVKEDNLLQLGMIRGQLRAASSKARVGEGYADAIWYRKANGARTIRGLWDQVLAGKLRRARARLNEEEWQRRRSLRALIEPQAPPDGGRDAVWPMVIQDMENRRQYGQEKYGQELKTWDGRKTLWDVYQELLDACVYIRKEIEERSQGHDAAPL